MCGLRFRNFIDFAGHFCCSIVTVTEPDWIACNDTDVLVKDAVIVTNLVCLAKGSSATVFLDLVLALVLGFFLGAI